MLLVLETKSEHKETIDMKVDQGLVIKMARFLISDKLIVTKN